MRVLALLLLASCAYDPGYGDGELACTAGVACPGALVCAPDLRCRAPGSFEVVEGAPETLLLSTPSPTSGTSVTFQVDASEPDASFQCSLDDAPFTACQRSQSYTGLAAGPHVFRVRAVDADGNLDPSPASFSWTVDPLVLDTSITAGPAALSGRSARFEFQSSRVALFECMLEPIETGWSPCESPKQYDELTERAVPGYLFKVRAQDAAGAVDDSPAEQAFMVDATGPAIEVSQPAAGGVVGTSFEVAFTTEAGAAVTCRVDDGPMLDPCPSNLGPLPGGAHQLFLEGRDVRGNPATTTVPFEVDAAGPTVVISGSPAAGAIVTMTTASFSFAPSAPEAGTVSYECRFTGQTSFSDCTSGFAVSGLWNPDPYKLEVRAKDRFGNTGPVAERNWSLTQLSTTIEAIRTTPVPVGTLVSIFTNVQMTVRWSDRFYVQEGVKDFQGITVRTKDPFANDGALEPGMGLLVRGIVTNIDGNLTLAQSIYVRQELRIRFQRKEIFTTAELLREANEGMLVGFGGETVEPASVAACAGWDVCMLPCDEPQTPVRGKDMLRDNTLLPGSIMMVDGILVQGPSGYFVEMLTGDENDDICI